MSVSRLHRKLNRIRSLAPTIPFDDDAKFVFMSDVHRGRGNHGDNFEPNNLLFFGALRHYQDTGFTYFELGDGDELWENKKLSPIIDAHTDVYRQMAELYQNNRFVMLYGNHDIVKRKKLTSKKYYKSFFCEEDVCQKPLFPGLTVHEGLILQHEISKHRIFLLHGHQGSLLNDTLWFVGRWLVRYLWHPLERIGIRQPSNVARAPRHKDKLAKRLSDYATKEGVAIIAGHTHAPHFPAENERYFNDGSCVHPRYITAIELENGALSLVKWSATLRDDLCVSVSRTPLSGPVPLDSFFKQT